MYKLYFKETDETDNFVKTKMLIKRAKNKDSRLVLSAGHDYDNNRYHIKTRIKLQTKIGFKLQNHEN